MDERTDLLIASVLSVTKRDWPMITAYWNKWFKTDLSDDYIAMANFSMGALVPFIVQAPPKLRAGIFHSLQEVAKASATEMEAILQKYEEAWNRPEKLAARYSVPPLKVEHEALAIVFVDSIEWRATQVIQGKEYYNLFSIGTIGASIAATTNEAKKAFQQLVE